MTRALDSPLRRRLLAGACGGALLALAGARFARADAPAALLEPDANGLRLPPGFRSRVVAQSGAPPVAGGRFRWHAAPDGGACFAARGGGWIYVSNAELPAGGGGAGALAFDRRGRLVDAYAVLAGTTHNCAGGPTPWGSWLSCEEHDAGRVWECDPTGRTAAVARPALGVFAHEAAAVDLARRQVYLTEDRPDGLLYRYTAPRPARAGRLDLEAGVLEAARVAPDGGVDWLAVPDAAARTRPLREQLPAATRFRGGEGAWFDGGVLWFTTKLDGRVWRYDVSAGRLAVLYDVTLGPRPPILNGVDNITLSPSGELLVAEDGDDMQVCAVDASGRARALVQVVGHSRSEVAGLAFDPSGSRLYFSSQRGAGGRSEDGVTYEVRGPFRRG